MRVRHIPVSAFVFVAVVASAVVIVVVKERKLAEEISRSKNPPELAPLPLPSPPLEETVTSGRFVVIGTVTQSKLRRGWEPAAAVEVDEWITDAPARVKRALSGVEDGHSLRAYIRGRGSGHPFPEGVVGSRYIVVVERAPRVLAIGDNEEVWDAKFQLVAAYPASAELLGRVRDLAAQIDATGPPDGQP